MLEEYFKILQINAEADEKQLKKAYRKLALKYHPDVNPDPDAAEKFQQICEAYEILLSRFTMMNRVYVSSAEETETDEYAYEEILKEAKEKAAERARMKYEKIKAEKEFFRNNDFFVLARYIGNYLAVPVSIAFVLFPVVKAFHEGIQFFFGLFFFWVIGGAIMIHIYSRRKTWFHPGTIDTRWKDIVKFFTTEIRDNVKEKCFYTGNRLADSTEFKFIMFKVKTIKLTNYGVYMHSVGYKRKYKEVVIPRSSRAYRIHFLLSFIKPIAFLSGLFFLPVYSFAWRFTAALVLSLIVSRLILLISGVLPKTSFLLTPFMIIKLTVWLAIMCTQTTLYPGLVLFTSEILPLFFLVLLLFLDMFLDLFLKVFPFHNKFYQPLLRQPRVVSILFENGYQNYLDVPVWSTIYPFLRWLI